MSEKISRRNFLKGAAMSAVSAGLLGHSAFASESSESPEEAYTYAETVPWDAEYDVAVMGFGGAGAVAAYYAAKSGARVLLFDAAPMGEEGGNTRVCGQWIVIGEDKEKLMQYYTGLYRGLEYDEELIDVFTTGQLGIVEQLKNDYQLDPDQFMRWKELLPYLCPEHPDVPGGDTLELLTLHQGYFDSYLWNVLKNQVEACSDQIDVWYSARGSHLIQDPATKTVIGVELEKDGQTLHVRAKNGVVMTCGGYENNSEMVANYLGIADHNPMGGLYNRGDGITMALEAGAQLWHMSCYEGMDKQGGSCLKMPEGERAVELNWESGSFFAAGTDGTRYMNETEESRHGCLSHCGEYIHPTHPSNTHLIFDQAMYDSLDWTALNGNAMKERLAAADTVEQLSEMLNMPALPDTLAEYNEFAKTGKDLRCGRTAESMVALSESGPYYALPINTLIINTQGGPKRNARAEVLDTEGVPIPHLYSAGEFGGLTGKFYQGATNVTECIIFGRIAGMNAAVQKDPLPLYTLEPAVEAPLNYRPAAEETEAIELAENEYIGVGTGIGGEVRVKVTVDDGKITAIEVLSHSETEGIGDQAVAVLPQRILEAQSLDVDTVAGATVTSRAILSAVADALSQAGIS